MKYIKSWVQEVQRIPKRTKQTNISRHIIFKLLKILKAVRDREKHVTEEERSVQALFSFEMMQTRKQQNDILKTSLKKKSTQNSTLMKISLENKREIRTF